MMRESQDSLAGTEQTATNFNTCTIVLPNNPLVVEKINRFLYKSFFCTARLNVDKLESKYVYEDG